MFIVTFYIKLTKKPIVKYIIYVVDFFYDYLVITNYIKLFMKNIPLLRAELCLKCVLQKNPYLQNFSES
jgi:hypothetical protein